MPSAAGFSNAEPEPPTTADDAAVSAPARGTDAGSAAEGAAAGGAEWETQWSETPPPEEHAPHHDASHGAHIAHDHHAHGGQSGAAESPDAGAAAAPAAPEHQPAEATRVHHAEYTEPHAPTLPGAESAAAEAADLETAQAASSAALTEGAASHAATPAGHLAVEQPYGEGSAAPAPDGSGPEGFAVKGNASSMTYHDETSPAYEETRAEVWFLSAAHAEAAGFRPPRRSRL
jgi:hypothetical protein